MEKWEQIVTVAIGETVLVRASHIHNPPLGGEQHHVMAITVSIVPKVELKLLAIPLLDLINQ